jgi:catechol 2,3-dioxygenase-like lactoylglutathione lyase family enzyme
MPDLRLDHVALPMFDPLATRAFYEGVLGLKLAEAWSGDDWGGRGCLMLTFAVEGGHWLALCAFRDPAGPLDGDWPLDARHYAFSAADYAALETWKKKLDAAAIAWREEDHGDQRSIYFADPSGTVIEITAPPAASIPRGRDRVDETIAAWVAGAP